MSRTLFYKRIGQHIQQTGYHMTIVSGGKLPRYAYTIGLREKYKFELILAGGIYLLRKELNQVFEHLFHTLQQESNPPDLSLDLAHLGRFSLRKVDPSWQKPLMLGVYDYYSIETFSAWQIVPDQARITLDTPDMSTPWQAESAPAWKWEHLPWPYNIPLETLIVTHLEALRGQPVTEIARWEVDDWEMFAGNGTDVQKSAARVVPLGVMLGIDPSLAPALALEIGKGIWREHGKGPWRAWGNS